MSFFARPNLDDIQFKQLTGSTLTMSGVTNFTGILKSKGIEIDATATGATAGDALVFDGTKIILTPISGGSSGMYYGNTPASITLGGISSGTILTGKTLSLILQELLVGTICSSPVTICGLYPWFWGNSVSAPTINQTLINGYACKCVASSIGSILVNNFNVSGKYIWFAIPYTSTSKTSWQGCNNPSNNGVIPGGLFPVACCMNIVSPESCWGSTCYKIYVSNYATSVNYGMAFSNLI